MDVDIEDINDVTLLDLKCLFSSGGGSLYLTIRVTIGSTSSFSSSRTELIDGLGPCFGTFFSSEIFFLTGVANFFSAEFLSAVNFFFAFDHLICCFFTSSFPASDKFYILSYLNRYFNVQTLHIS